MVNLMGRSKNQLPIALFVVFFLFYILTRLPVGYEMDIWGDYVSLLPGLFLMTIAIFGIKGTKGGGLIVGFGLLGVSMAILIGSLNTLGIWIPDLVTASLTVLNMKLLAVVGGTLLGVIAYFT